MSTHSFAIKWLKSFRSDPEDIVALYADGFHFTDPVLDQHGITDREDLKRVFGPYANKDENNGIGINNFRIDEAHEYEKASVFRWTWEPVKPGAFLGVPVDGKQVRARGITFHQFDDEGRITREESYWDAAGALTPFAPRINTRQRFKPLPA